MRFRSTCLTAVCTLAVAACSDSAVGPVSPQPRASGSLATAADQLAGQYVVTFKGNGVPKDLAARVKALGGSVMASYNALGVATVSGLSGAASQTLGKGTDIASVDADAMISVGEPASESNVAMADVAATSDASAASQLDPSTAYFFRRQWNYTAISARQAWAAGYLGSSDVKVAILDTGIDPTYPDLVGLVDAAHSTSFVHSDDALIAQFFPGAPLYTDLNAHGTHVASTVSSKAAVVAGVTSKTTLMAVKVLGVSGSGPFSGIFAGLVYATDNGANVISMSLGSSFAKSQSKGFVGLLNRAVNYAHSRGVIVIVAAGNDATDLDHDGNGYAIFCSNGKVVCVSATGPDRAATVNGPYFPSLDLPAVYSNYGRSAINVAAPGGNFNPTTGTAVYVYQACSRTWLVLANAATRTYAKSVCALYPARAYALGEIGTSMAAPHVSGLAALMAVRYGRNPGQIRAAIEQSADDLGQRGTDPQYGKGRINVARAVGVE